MQTLDCRGLACPAPVMETKRLIDRGGVLDITVTVDNKAAVENVSRFLTFSGFAVTVSEQGKDFTVQGRRAQDVPAARDVPITCEVPAAKILVFCPTDRIGVGDDELGKKLMASFLKTLPEMGRDLWRLVLVNNGVKLAVEGSPALADLAALEKNGTTILVCGTCLNHFALLEKKALGETTNMMDIVTSMQLADKVISV
ncbi:MAG: sulfurtransferase-like selenium metabolism protein YedF [Thermodesulfobacteriota bacterium]